MALTSTPIRPDHHDEGGTDLEVLRDDRSRPRERSTRRFDSTARPAVCIPTRTRDVRPFTGRCLMAWSEPLAIRSPTAGTISLIAQPGQRLVNGALIAVIGGQPVVWLDGDVPAWRDMEVGIAGVDVVQLRRALAALGFDDGDRTADQRYSMATAAAVRRWQASLGAPSTGRVDCRCIVFGGARTRVVATHVPCPSERPAGAVLADIDVDVRRALFVADRDQLQRLELGEVVTLQFGELDLRGRITSLRTDGDQAIAGVVTPGSPFAASAQPHEQMVH